MPTNLYLLRQSILEVLRDSYGPVPFDRMQLHVALFHVDPALAMDQLRQLADAGYVKVITLGDGDYYALTPNGQAQAAPAPGARLDSFIWGARALS